MTPKFCLVHASLHLSSHCRIPNCEPAQRLPPRRSAVQVTFTSYIILSVCSFRNLTIRCTMTAKIQPHLSMSGLLCQISMCANHDSFSLHVISTKLFSRVNLPSLHGGQCARLCRIFCATQSAPNQISARNPILKIGLVESSQNPNVTSL